ncbi:DUF1365 domain-containing protein [Streptomyces sp. NPDC090306]|uniref:DUF1365 domain-containing protein n=1 Tax=Streptomyces sp. NPDC090306 TaxID=3365961 RepID=UPI00381251CF
MPAAPALYECVITHVRTAPVRYDLRHRTYMWLVDPDRPPRLPLPLRPLAGFRARDHFGGGAPTLRAGLDAYLASRGVDLAGGPVVMLTHARVLGHVFNPLTLYWCHTPDGTQRCVVAEVHNTYGERHCYLLEPEETAGPAPGGAAVPAPGGAAAGRTGEDSYRTAKEFYVSPFFPVDGDYRMRLPPPGERLGVTVRLEREGGSPFTATLRGRRRPPTPAALLRSAARHPWSTLVVSAAIRFHGVRLWRRGLPVVPRPPHRPQEGTR